MAASEQSKIAACNIIQFLIIKIIFNMEYLKTAMLEPIVSTEQVWPWSLEICIERTFNNVNKKIPKLSSDSVIQQSITVSSAQSPVSRAQRPAFSVQSRKSSVQNPASRVQHPGSSVQSRASSIESPEFRVLCPESCIQSPASRIQRLTLAFRDQEFQYAFEMSINNLTRKMRLCLSKMCVYFLILFETFAKR